MTIDLWFHIHFTDIFTSSKIALLSSRWRFLNIWLKWWPLILAKHQVVLLADRIWNQQHRLWTRFVFPFVWICLCTYLLLSWFHISKLNKFIALLMILRHAFDSYKRRNWFFGWLKLRQRILQADRFHHSFLWHQTTCPGLALLGINWI